MGRCVWVVLLLGCTQCSRSALDDDSLPPLGDATADARMLDGSGDGSDGHFDAKEDGPDVKSCGPTNCAGCCDATGECQAGTSDGFCGGGGGSCVSCKPTFHCNGVSTGNACVSKPANSGDQCGYANCPAGCCARINDVSQDLYCFQGDGDFTCGIGGQICANCATNHDV